MKKELMPPNTKKCCGDCGFAQLPPKTGIDCVQPKCPCHTPAVEKCGCPVPNGIFKQKGRTAWYECSKCGKGIEFTITPTPEKEKCERCGIENPPQGRWKDPVCQTINGNIRTRYETHLLNPTPTPAVEDWEYGNLTIDKMKNIIEVCDVKFVGLKQDCLNISFAPRNATGKAWQELKERMHRIIGE